MTNNERVPAGTADRLAAILPERADGGSSYIGHGWNQCRAAWIAYLRSIEAEPLTCTLADIPGMADYGDVVRWGTAERGGFMVAVNAGWRTPHGEFFQELLDRDWHTFIHGGAVYSIREQADAGGDVALNGYPESLVPGDHHLGDAPAPEQDARGEYCPDCHGAGEDWCNDKRRCTRCGGSGVVDAPEQDAAQQADAPSVAERFEKLVDAVALIQAELEMCGNEEEDWSERLRDMEKRLNHAHERLDDAADEFEEQIRTLQQDVAALKQQGGGMGIPVPGDLRQIYDNARRYRESLEPPECPDCEGGGDVVYSDREDAPEYPCKKCHGRGTLPGTVIEVEQQGGELREGVHITAAGIAKLRQRCHDNYNGGHHDEPAHGAFHHGMDTVCNVLESYLPQPAAPGSTEEAGNV